MFILDLKLLKLKNISEHWKEYLNEKQQNYYLDYLKLYDKKKEKFYSSMTYKNILKINKECMVVISEKGEQENLLFYNIKKNIFCSKSYGYSYYLTPNSISFSNLKIDNIENILLCACFEKDENNVKYGFRYFYDVDINKEVKDGFEKTGQFKPLCFCLLNTLEVQKKFSIKKDSNKYKVIEYFLIGGFDYGDNKGKLLLFKIMLNALKEIKIEYCPDIQFKHFDNPVTNLFQSEKNGNISIYCDNGEIFELVLLDENTVFNT